jgi:hypothetical protein
MGARTAEELARVASKLEELEVLARASDDGVLTSSHVRELARVATPEDQQEWVARARELTVRGLRQAIKEHKAQAAPDAAAEGSGADPEGAVEPDPDGEDEVVVQVDAPPYFRAKTATALDLYRKVAGSDRAPLGAAVEAFAAEWSSGAPLPEEHEEHDHPEGQPCPKCHGEGAPKPKQGVTAQTERMRERRNERERLEEEHFKHWAYLDVDGRPEPPLPYWLKASRGPISKKAELLDRQLRMMEAARRELDAMTGRILFTMSEIGFFSCMGFVDIAHYAREQLGLAGSTARRLQHIERCMWEMPEVREAFYTGEIGLAKVAQLIRVAKGQDLTDWMERARGVTVRRLELEVRAVLRRADLVVANVLPPIPWAQWYEVLPKGTNLERYASAVDEACRAPEEPPKGDPWLRRRREPPKGPSVAVRFRMEPGAAEFFFDCVERVRALEGKPLPLWECLDRFMDAFFEAHGRKDPRRYALNHKVMARDGWRCQVPGCRRRGGILHMHHIKHGPGERVDEEWNCSCLCAFHHLQAIHENGWIRVEGQAPDHLTWYMGKTDDGQPLFVVGPGESIAPEAPRRRVDSLFPIWV